MKGWNRASVRPALGRRLPLGCSGNGSLLTERSNGFASAWLRRPYALTSDGKFIRSNAPAPARAPRPAPPTFLRAEDAKEMEERFLNVATPQGKDPWQYHRHLLPRFTGMKGDANVAFDQLKTPERLVMSFLEHMTYPNELGHNVKLNIAINTNRPLYHWADETVFGVPPVAVVRLQYTETPEHEILSYAEIDWWKRTIRVWELRNDTQRDEDSFEDDEEDPDTLFKREAAEYPIPPRWLLEMKKRKWPAPPSPAMIDLPGMQAQAIPAQEKPPLTTEPFPHRQAAMLGRTFTIEEEEEEEEEFEKEDPTDETLEELAVGNAFVPKGTSADDFKNLD